MNETKALEFDKILSLLSDCCVSEPAKERARTLLPFDEEERCRRALEETDEAFVLYKKFSVPSFSGVSDVSQILKKAQRGAVLAIPEFLKIAGVLRSARLLEEYLKNHAEKEGELYKYLVKFSSNKYLEEKIFSDFPSEEEVSDTASPKLRDIRRKIMQAKNKVRSSLENYIKSPNYQKYLQDNIVTIRNDRFVIPVKAENKNEIPGLVHDTSSSGSTVFIEPMSVVTANNEIAELSAAEKREIENILFDLSREAEGFSDGINQGYFLSVYFDFLFAKAKLADRMNAVKPVIGGKVLRLEKARHPLIDKNSVVPTDISLGKDYSVLMITGPNTGGKTVTLKTAGLLSLMAKAALFIPAKENSTVPFYDNIFADIGDEQSIEQSLSTFSSHMSHIIKILEDANSHSLVLLDELGSGTDPAEGAALAVSIIKTLMKTGAYAAATTHYPELKIFAIHTPGVENASCEFDLSTLKPTYRLLTGTPGKSNAFAIASKLGMPENIISEAKKQLSSENVRFETVIADLEISRKEAEISLKAAEENRAKAKAEAEKIIAEAEKIKSEAEKDAEKSRRKALDLWEKTVTESDFIIDELENLRKEKDKKDFKEKLEKAKSDYEKKAKENEKLKRSEAKKPINRPLVKGDTVRILSLDKEATVLSPADKKGYVELQAGIIRTKIKLSDLELCDKPKIKTQISVPSFKAERGSREVSNEIDIRGENVLDAEEIVENFLNNCSLSGLKTVSIIHGKGTGVLRQGVHALLKRNPFVESFRLGTFGEGESGVTVVTLK